MRKSILVCFVVISSMVNAQRGGIGSFEFLNMHANARIAALGGSAIATPDNDASLVIQNPSLLTAKMDKQLTMNYQRYVADMGLGYFGYAFNTKSAGPLMVGVQYLNYGTFDKKDIDNTSLGSFAASDFAFHLSTSRIMNKWNIGATGKFIYSTLESYTSVGFAADVAASYRSRDSLFLLTAVANNVGYQITTYTGTSRQQYPLNLQVGFSKKFAHNPLRISVIAHDLQKIGDLLYQNSAKNSRNVDLVTGLPIQEDFNALSFAMSHLIVNTELVFGQGFMLRFGYNDLRRRELTLPDARSWAGFSWGFGLKVRKFMFSYGSASFYSGNATNHFTIVTNLQEFYKKKKE
ncbi:MAG: type IX secretion system protein PorQ [Bacteroidota bacterium]